MRWRRRKRGTPKQIGKAFPIRGATAAHISSRYHMTYKRPAGRRFKRRIRRRQIAKAREEIARLGERQPALVEQPFVVLTGKEQNKEEMAPEEIELDEIERAGEPSPQNIEYVKNTEKITKKTSSLAELRGIFSDAWSRLKEAASSITDAMKEESKVYAKEEP